MRVLWVTELPGRDDRAACPCWCRPPLQFCHCSSTHGSVSSRCRYTTELKTLVSCVSCLGQTSYEFDVLDLIWMTE